MFQNGNRIADIKGADNDVQRAIQAIQERFLGGGGGGFRGRDDYHQNDSGRSQNSEWGQQPRDRPSRQSAPQMQQQTNDDDEWDNAPSHKPIKMESQPNDDWDLGEMEKSYNPSVNNSQSNNNSCFEPPKRSSFPDNSRGSFGGNRRGGFENRSSSYSNNNRIPYRSNENPPPPATNASNDDYVIDWDKANKEAEVARKARWEKCPKMLKNFYNEHPEVTNMSDEEVEKFRVENKNIVVARTFAEEGSTEAMPKPTTKFEHAFENHPDLMHEIKKAGFEKPSPIQSQMWPILLRGEDCIGIAQTGT
jgi:hypothetical protein